jgi:hypothetical protein
VNLDRAVDNFVGQDRSFLCGLCDSVAILLFLQAGLDTFGESFEVADALDFIVGKLYAEVIFDAGEKLESLQAVDTEFLEEVVVGRKSASGKLEVRSGEIQYFLSGLFEGRHDSR